MKVPKFLKFRAERDLYDYLFIGGVILSLLVSFGVFKKKTEILLRGEFKYIVTADDFNLRETVYNAMVPSTKSFEDRLSISAPNNYALEQCGWLHQFRLFEIIFTNKSINPVSIEDLEVRDFHFETPTENLKLMISFLDFPDENFSRFIKPYFNLAGRETKKVNAIVGFLMYIERDSETAKLMHKESVKFMTRINGNTVLLDSLYRNDSYLFEINNENKRELKYLQGITFSIGKGKKFQTVKDFLSHPEAEPFVFAPVYQKYLSECNFISLKFSVVDNFNNQFRSEEIDLSTDSIPNAYMIAK